MKSSNPTGKVLAVFLTIFVLVLLLSCFSHSGWVSQKDLDRYGELFVALIGFLIFIFPQILLSFFSLLALANSENYQSRLKEIRKDGPSGFNEKFAEKHGDQILKFMGSKKELHGKPTLIQIGLTRFLGFMLMACVVWEHYH